MSSTPAVLIDHNRHTAILLTLGPKWSVMIEQSPSLSLSRVPTREVQERWQTYDYPVVTAATKYLKSAFSVSERADFYLKEIVMGMQYTKEALEAMSEKQLLETMQEVLGKAPTRLKPKSKGVEAILAHQVAKAAAIEVGTEQKVRRKGKSASDTTKKVAKEQGYKGHRAGSRKEQAHKMFDDLKHDKDKCMPKIVALGIAESTAKSWMQTWSR